MRKKLNVGQGHFAPLGRVRQGNDGVPRSGHETADSPQMSGITFSVRRTASASGQPLTREPQTTNLGIDEMHPSRRIGRVRGSAVWGFTVAGVGPRIGVGWLQARSARTASDPDHSDRGHAACGEKRSEIIYVAGEEDVIGLAHEGESGVVDIVSTGGGKQHSRGLGEFDREGTSLIFPSLPHPNQCSGRSST